MELRLSTNSLSSSSSKTSLSSNIFIKGTNSSDEKTKRRRDSAILQEKLLAMDKNATSTMPPPSPKTSVTTLATSNSNSNSTTTDVDYSVKIMILGDSAVGKTSLLRAWCEGDFHSRFMPTMGLDYRQKHLVVDGHKMKVQVWDSAGQERFKVITQAYYRGSHGMLLVFDVTNRTSFNNIHSWVKSVSDHTTYSERKVRFVLVGNKTDLPNRVVTREEAENLARAFGVSYAETSAKQFDGIEDCFTSLLRAVIDEHFSTLAGISPVTNSTKVILVAPPVKTSTCICGF